MLSNKIPPQLGLELFTCPHCGAISHQTWFRVFIQYFSNKERPVILPNKHFDRLNFSKIEDEDERKRLQALKDRFDRNEVTYKFHEYGENCGCEFINFHVNRCYSCDAFSFWVKDALIYPQKTNDIAAHKEMPPQIRADFEEAAAIVDKSPRGAAALLRLCIQKLMPVLGERGANINDDIAALVKKGLDVKIQQALDIVRVIGNSAVHPGELDLRDDKTIALTLFSLVNLIVDKMIATPKQIEEIYKTLPPAKLEAIQKRDA